MFPWFALIRGCASSTRYKELGNVCVGTWALSRQEKAECYWDTASKRCVFVQTVAVSSGRISLQAAQILVPVKLDGKTHRANVLYNFPKLPFKELPLVSFSSRPWEAEIVFLFQMHSRINKVHCVSNLKFKLKCKEMSLESISEQTSPQPKSTVLPRPCSHNDARWLWSIFRAEISHGVGSLASDSAWLLDGVWPPYLFSRCFVFAGLIICDL